MLSSVIEAYSLENSAFFFAMYLTFEGHLFQLSIFSFQSSTFSFQSSTFNFQPSAFNPSAIILQPSSSIYFLIYRPGQSQ